MEVENSTGLNNFAYENPAFGLPEVQLKNVGIGSVSVACVIYRQDGNPCSRATAGSMADPAQSSIMRGTSDSKAATAAFAGARRTWMRPTRRPMVAPHGAALEGFPRQD